MFSRIGTVLGRVREAGRRLGRLAAPAAFLPAKGSRRRFSVDAVDDRRRRRAPVSRLRTEDAELTQEQRGQLVTGHRDIARNFALVGWAIRKDLDYVSTFRFQCRTGQTNLDTRIENLMKWWGRRENCDVAARHSWRRLIRLAQARRTLDGDVGLLKLADGRVQGIEGDRIRNPAGGANIPFASLTHGVETDAAGRALRYCICRRTGSGLFGQSQAFEFERLIDAGDLILFGYFDRLDQVRGASPVTAALNSYRDVYESFDYALAKTKIAQLFALAFYRDQSQPPGVVSAEGDEADEGDEPHYKIDFGKGPAVLDLDPGDRAEFLESKQPSTEAVSYWQVAIAVALKSLDIPYSFFAENFSNYSGSRQALLQYEQSAEQKRADLLDDVLTPVTVWKLATWIAAGLVTLPDGWTVWDVINSCQWIPAGLPWIDPLKETQANVAQVGSALNSRTRILRKAGLDFYEVADDLAREKAYLVSKELPWEIGAPPDVPVPVSVQE